MILSLTLTVAFAAPAPQEPGGDEVVARFKLDDRPTAIAVDDLALEMAWHLHRTDAGLRASRHMVDTALVQMEAKAKGLVPSPEEVQKLWRKIADQLRAAGKRPEDYDAIRNASRAQLEADLAIQLAQEKLVRAELGMTDDEAVSGAVLGLWLREARQRHKVVEDPDQLPLGTVARIDDRALALIDLGRLLLRTSTQQDRERFIRQIVVIRSLEATGSKRDIVVTRDDIDAELRQRQREVEANPRFRGISFADLLKTQGMTVEMLSKSKVFRVQILRDKLVALEHPAAELLAELQDKRQEVLDRIGPRRNIGTILTRALEPPNELVKRTFGDALEHQRGLRERLLAGADFTMVAKIESEDPATKMDGGDTGWHHRASKALPETVRAAAFELPIGGLSEPVRVETGYCLVKVLDVEPPLTEAEILGRMRSELGDEMTRQILEQAEIEFVDG